MRLKLRNVLAMFLLCATSTWYLLHTTTRQREDAREESEKHDTAVVDGVAVPVNQSFFMPHSPLTQSWSTTDTIDSPQSLVSSLLPFFHPGSSDINGRPKLHVVTYASHGGIDDRFCRSLESIYQNNINLKLLGWGQKWKGLPQKLEAALSYAKTQPKQDLLLFVDAFDVLFMGNTEEIIDTYLNMHSPKLLFGAECGCWPRTRACFSRYPPSPTRYRYLNSGTWIARMENAVYLIEELMLRAGKGEAAYIANDQRLASDMYVSGKMNVKIDHYAQLFQSMHATLGPPLPYCNPIEDLVYEPETVSSNMSDYGGYNNIQFRENGGRNVFKNRRTGGTRPLIFHMNGGGKKYFLELEKRAWYRQSYTVDTINVKSNLQLMQLSVNVVESTGNERFVRFGEVCPHYNHNRVRNREITRN